MFLYRLPCLPSANKTGLGHKLARDQSLPGQCYGFYPSEFRTIYIYIALQQHDVQIIQLLVNSKVQGSLGYSITEFTTCSYRSTPFHSSSWWLQLIAGLCLNPQWSWWPAAVHLPRNRWWIIASVTFPAGTLVVNSLLSSWTHFCGTKLSQISGGHLVLRMIKCLL